MDQCGVEDTVFCEVDIMHTTFYNCTSTRKLLQTAKFAHMNGHWKDYDTIRIVLPYNLIFLDVKTL